MWIRSQYGNILMDCDFLAVEDHGSKYEVITLSGKSGISIGLGTYSTKEKAIRVLDAIHGQLNEFDLEGTVVYQMPSDEEVGLWFPEKDDSDKEDDF